MGFTFYVLHRGESIEELDARESADYFALKTKTTVELGKLAAQAGVDPIPTGDNVAVPPDQADEIARNLRRYLATSEPGPAGSGHG